MVEGKYVVMKVSKTRVGQIRRKPDTCCQAVRQAFKQLTSADVWNNIN